MNTLSGYYHEVNGKFVKMTDDEVAEMHRRSDLETAARIKAKGHDCMDNAVHEWDTSLRDGYGNDVYICGICRDLLQVG